MKALVLESYYTKVSIWYHGQIFWQNLSNLVEVMSADLFNSISVTQSIMVALVDFWRWLQPTVKLWEQEWIQRFMQLGENIKNWWHFTMQMGACTTSTWCTNICPYSFLQWRKAWLNDDCVTYPVARYWPFFVIVMAVPSMLPSFMKRSIRSIVFRSHT